MFEECVYVSKNDSGIYMIATLCLLVAVLFTVAIFYFVCPSKKHGSIGSQQKSLYLPGFQGAEYFSKHAATPFSTPTKQSYSNNDVVNNNRKHSDMGSLRNTTNDAINHYSKFFNRPNRGVTFDFGKPANKYYKETMNDFGASSCSNINKIFDSYGINNNKSILKRCSSSQELCQLKRKPSQLFSSMPDVHRTASNPLNVTLYDTGYHPKKSRSSNSISRYTTRLHPANGNIIEMDEDTDEGHIQCIIYFDRERMLLTVSSLFIQTLLPAGIPGFIIEVTIVPNKHDIKRSKVYTTKESEISTYIEEIFQIFCSYDDLTQCCLIIALKPVLGNVILYAETELGPLKLLTNRSVSLAGLLKGVITHTN